MERKVIIGTTHNLCVINEQRGNLLSLDSPDLCIAVRREQTVCCKEAH